MQQNVGSIDQVSPFLPQVPEPRKLNRVCLRPSPQLRTSSPTLGVHFEGSDLRTKRTLAGHYLHAEQGHASVQFNHVVVLTSRILQNRQTHVHSSVFKAREAIFCCFSELFSLRPSSKTNSLIACTIALVRIRPSSMTTQTYLSARLGMHEHDECRTPAHLHIEK